MLQLQIIWYSYRLDFLKGALSKNWSPVEFIPYTNRGHSVLQEQLLTTAAVSQLARLAVHLVAHTERTEHKRSVVVCTTSTENLDWYGSGLAGYLCTTIRIRHNVGYFFTLCRIFRKNTFENVELKIWHIAPGENTILPNSRRTFKMIPIVSILSVSRAQYLMFWPTLNRVVM